MISKGRYNYCLKKIYLRGIIILIKKSYGSWICKTELDKKQNCLFNIKALVRIIYKVPKRLQNIKYENDRKLKFVRQ